VVQGTQALGWPADAVAPLGIVPLVGANAPWVTASGGRAPGRGFATRPAASDPSQDEESNTQDAW